MNVFPMSNCLRQHSHLSQLLDFLIWKIKTKNIERYSHSWTPSKNVTLISGPFFTDDTLLLWPHCAQCYTHTWTPLYRVFGVPSRVRYLPTSSQFLILKIVWLVLLEWIRHQNWLRKIIERICKSYFQPCIGPYI